MQRTLLATLMLSLASFSMARPVSYDVDPSHTLAQYQVDHLGFSMQSGYFTKLSGKVTLDLAAHSGSVDISIDTDSLQTFWPARDKHLKSAAFFNVEKYPAMIYKANKLVFDGDKLTQVIGSLTLLGVTRPVTLDVTHFHGGKNPMSGVEQYGANAVAHIKRSEFGMKTFLPAIGDDVTLNLTIEAHQMKN